LHARQVAQLKVWLGKDPRQLRFPFALWTVKMIQSLIKERFGVAYGISGVHKLLKELGYSYQKPRLKAEEQNSEKVNYWLTEEYPAIKKEAQKEKRAIYFADESGFQATHNKMRTWGKKGKRPVVSHTGRRFSKGVISAVTPQGKLQFMQYDGGMNQELFISFLKRLEGCEKKKITLIVDGLPVHKGKKVKEYVEASQGRIKLYFLPGYSPELNPDELVWSTAKSFVQRKMVRTKKELERTIATFLHSIQKRKGYIEQLFLHPEVAYITKT
jgi:transposase